MSLRPMIAAFGSIDGQLAVGGMPLDRLTARVGSTPYFAYDRRLLTERVELLRATLPPTLHLSYAVKANPMPAVVQHLAGLVDALDVASSLEMQTALDTQMPSARVSFAGPGKTEAEIVQAVAAGVTIEMESATEASRVIEAGERLGVRPRVALRVNPDFQVKGSGMRLGGGPQQFGVDAEQVPEFLTTIAAADLEFLGFHVFAGSQNLNAEILCEAQRKTVELILALAEKAPAPVRYVNLGGGFGIPYFDKDVPLDLAAIGANLAELADGRIAPNLPGGRGRDRTRPLHRGGVRRVRHPGGRSQGVARAHLPRGRRRHAPPVGGVRQLRPGHPPQLSDRRRQPAQRAGRVGGDRRRLPVYAAGSAGRRRHASGCGNR